MKSLTTEEANRVLLQSLKKTKKRTFNETGIHFDGDIWAFPNNRKIFIGVNDYDMSDNTCFLVKRAMFRHELTQQIKSKRIAIAVGGVVVLGLILLGIKTCKPAGQIHEKNKTVCTTEYGHNSAGLAKFMLVRQK